MYLAEIQDNRDLCQSPRENQKHSGDTGRDHERLRWLYCKNKMHLIHQHVSSVVPNCHPPARTLMTKTHVVMYGLLSHHISVYSALAYELGQYRAASMISGTKNRLLFDRWTYGEGPRSFHTGDPLYKFAICSRKLHERSRTCTSEKLTERTPGPLLLKLQPLWQLVSVQMGEDASLFKPLAHPLYW